MLHQTAVLHEAVTQLALAQAEGGGGAAPGFLSSPLILMFAVMFAVLYFVTIRPQAKREKERREMLDAIKKGDRVLTAGGIFGTVVGSDSQKVVLRISDDANLKIELLRTSVARVLTADDEKPDEEEDNDDEDTD